LDLKSNIYLAHIFLTKNFGGRVAKQKDFKNERQ